MEQQESKTFNYLNLRVEESLEKVDKKRFHRKKLFSGERLVCEIFIDESSPFRRELDYSRILNDVCDNFKYRSESKSELPSCKQLSEAIELLDKMEQIGIRLQYPPESGELSQVIREYQIEIFNKGTECLKILFPSAAKSLREKEETETTL
jgi:hypothetical protein